MIVNIRDFQSFLKKINSGSEKYGEFIFPYRATLEKIDIPSFRAAKFEETSNSGLCYYRTIDPLKILFYLSREKVYPLKYYNAEKIIMG